ncbi:MAG: DUF3784 domain-containing protein [Eubacteriales bacterium]|nr:DUF3784 domain-containing protein [Eubacteriales bacterium]MDD4541408.1 DUF3784 domain-containing protein [Eubacteriales bacterium]
MFELIFLILVGFLFLIFGWRIWKNEQITLIHSYHYKKVSEEDKKSYTEEFGKSLTLIGIGIILTAAVNFITKTAYGWILFALFFITGLLKIYKIQKEYNKGVF